MPVTLPEPSKEADVHTTSPVIPIVLPVARAVAVAALPVVLPDVPDTFPVTSPVSAAVIVPAEKLPLASRETIVVAVFALVALDVTVNVAPSALAEPYRPTPLTAPVAT